MLSALSHWLRRAARPTPARRPNRNTLARPRLEALENRCVPAVLFVTKTLDDISVPGTLRYAVAHANNGDTIDIPGPTHHRFSKIPSPCRISPRKIGSSAAAKRFRAILSLDGWAFNNDTVRRRSNARFSAA